MPFGSVSCIVGTILWIAAAVVSGDDPTIIGKPPSNSIAPHGAGTAVLITPVRVYSN